jgi:hypothetical protein
MNRIINWLKQYDTSVSNRGFAVFRISLSFFLLVLISSIYYYRPLIFNTIPHIAPNPFPAKLFISIWAFVVLGLMIGWQTRIMAVINYLFVVDIFNEGVDIPEIDTVLFLRPTESLTIFLQQLGRGLRLADGKECLTVLDFVGNARPEYNFENKFRALIGKTTTAVKKEIEDNFPHLPLGCSIILERKAKEIILSNIIAATTLNQNQLIQKIQSFHNHSILPLNLRSSSFILYSRLCAILLNCL